MRAAIALAAGCLLMVLGAGCSGHSLSPDARASGLFEKADDLIGKGRIQQARKSLSEAEATDPTNWKLRRAVFLLWVTSDHPKEAIDSGEGLLQELGSLTRPARMPNSAAADVAVVLSEQYRKLLDAEGAMQALEKALELDPSNSTACNNIAYDLAEQDGDLSRALVLARRAVKAAPRSADFVDTLGWVLYKQGKYREALEHIRRAVELAPYSAELRGHLALAEQKLGRRLPAYVEARKALVLRASPETASLLRKTVIKPYNPPGPL